MRLNEFAKPKDYTLTTADMTKFLKRIKRIWRGVDIDATAPFVWHLGSVPKDVRQMLADARP